MKHETQKDKVQEALDLYEREQREFENHWLWKELNTTPKEFFGRVHEVVKSSGIAEDVWKQKLSEARLALETRLKEKKGQYQKFNLNSFKGLKA